MNFNFDFAQWGMKSHRTTHAAGNETLRYPITLGIVVAGIAMVASALPQVALAHGFAGKRFFPATLATDDPYVAAEATPFQIEQSEDADGVDATDFSSDITALVTPRLTISVGEAYRHLNPPDGADRNGFNNLELGAKYALGVFPKHEGLLSVGIDAEVGGTGSNIVDAESESTISPTVFFGKGLGDLPDALKYLKPIAITGIVGPDFVTGSSGVQSVSYGLALEYNLHYLQSFVDDVGLHGPVERLIPVVEAALSTCTDHCEGSATTGTINPGLIYFGHYGQIGAEALIPINDASGSSVGGILQFHLYMDNVFAHVPGFGRPLFE